MQGKQSSVTACRSRDLEVRHLVPVCRALPHSSLAECCGVQSLPEHHPAFAVSWWVLNFLSGRKAFLELSVQSLSLLVRLDPSPHLLSVKGL